MPQSKNTASTSPPRRRLGRGLTSLINMPVRVETARSEEPRITEPADVAAPPVEQDGRGVDHSGDLQMIPTDRVRPSPYQPRKQFDQAALESLASSIREAGMMQPIVVRPGDQSGQYELVAGERRWRAAQIVGLTRIPAIVREVDHQTAAQFALIENVQREDLNAIERAEAFHRLAQEFGLTHQEIADRVGLDRTSVTNHLRLLELDRGIRTAVASGALSMGHGRALLAIANLERRAMLAGRAARQGWSVRELERRAKAEGGSGRGLAAEPRALPVHLEDLQRRLGEHLGSKVRIVPGRKKGAGRLIIEFYTLDEFEGLLQRMSFEAG